MVVLIYGGLLVATWWEFKTTPKGFVPAQDMGYLIVNVQMPDASSILRTRVVTSKTQEIARKVPGIAHTLSVSGMSFLNNATSSIFGSMFVILDDFEKRRTPETSVDAILKNLNAAFDKQIPEAKATVLPAAPIRGVGRTGGFTFVVEERTGADQAALQELQTAIDDLVNEVRNSSRRRESRFS